MRAPTSQPVGIHTVMEILHELGAHDDPMIGSAADWLASITREDGGIPFVLEDAMAHPHAPWWHHADESSVTQTAANAAALHNLRVQPPVAGAGRRVPVRAASPGSTRRASARTSASATTCCSRSTSSTPIRRPAARTRPSTPSARSRADPGSELPSPLDLSPSPGARSRRLFDDAVIERDLDALEQAQKDDGGWTVSWPDWNAAAAIEWRGVATVVALSVLRANGRL